LEGYTVLKLGIIGTAGRGQDGQKLTLAHWRMMCCVVQTVATTLGAKELVSGGSAWSDHVAVALFLDSEVDKLTLHLPCDFIDVKMPSDQSEGPRMHFDPSSQCGRRLNELHDQFRGITKLNPFDNLRIAFDCHAEKRVDGGFHARNTYIAQESDALLAFTFNDGAIPSNGGTLDTFKKFKSRSCQPNQSGLRAFHFSLISHRLYES
jgi:hypothetical protein